MDTQAQGVTPSTTPLSVEDAEQRWSTRYARLVDRWVLATLRWNMAMPELDAAGRPLPWSKKARLERRAAGAADTNPYRGVVKDMLLRDAHLRAEIRHDVYLAFREAVRRQTVWAERAEGWLRRVTTCTTWEVAGARAVELLQEEFTATGTDLATATASAEATDPEALLLEAEEVRARNARLEAFLATLPGLSGPDATLLRGRLEQRPYRDLADALGVKEGALRVRLFRLVDRLQHEVPELLQAVGG